MRLNGYSPCVKALIVLNLIATLVLLVLDLGWHYF